MGAGCSYEGVRSESDGGSPAKKDEKDVRKPAEIRINYGRRRMEIRSGGDKCGARGRIKEAGKRWRN